MPQNDGEVRVEITGDNSKLKKELKETRSAVKDTTDSVSEMTAALEDTSGASKNFKDVAEIVNNVAKNAEDAADAVSDTADEVDNLGDSIKDAGDKTITFGDLLKANLLSDYIQKGIGKLADGFWGFLKKGVDLASNLQEVQNVVDTTFGDGAEQIYSWSEAAAESFGMSSLQAQNFNGTLGAMLKSMGLTDDAVLKMSTDMVGLSGDMASFYNLDIEQAFEKIRAGISGETEPLKQLGINMSVANLEAYALSQGIETAYDKMSQSEQAILRYNYLMSVTADAQGDFAKTSDSFANQQRILQLQWENLSASLGEKFLPHLNDVIITINDKMPQAQATAEKLITPFADGFGWLIDHGDAVIAVLGSLAAGTGAYAFAAGGATTATELWTAAMGKLAAIKAAINPLALVAAAAIAGAVAFKNYVDNMDISAPEQEFVRNVRKETEVLQQQRQAFEELRKSQAEKDEADLASANNIKRLWGELQTYVDENGNVISSNERASEIIGLLNDNYNMNIGFIDGQIQKYSELSSSMDDYIENLRLEARIRNGQESYDEAIKNIDDLMKKRDELKLQEEVQYKTYEKLKAQGFDNAGDVAERRNAISNEIAEVDALISEYESAAQEYESLFEKKKSSGSGGQTWAPDDSNDEESDRDQDLKDFVAGLDKKQNLRKISEQEYYDELYDYLVKHEDRESVEWFKQLGRYEDYQQKQADAAVKAAEKSKSERDKLAKEQQEAEKNRINDSVTALKDRLEADKNYTEEMYYNDLESLIGTLDKESELYKKFNSEILKGRRKLADDEEKKLLDEQNKIVEDGLSEILKTYEKAFDDLEKKREAYRKKLMSIGGDLFSVDTVKDKNGKEKTTYTVNNLNEQLKKMRDFHSQVSKLKARGASESLMSELFALDDKDAAQFSKYLSEMSSAEFTQINELYNEKQKLADELANDLYASEAKKLSESILTELDRLSVPSADYGKAAADSYIDAFKSEFEERSGEFAELFKNTDIAAEIKATVETEISRYSAAAFTAPAVKSGSDTAASENNKNYIAELIKEFNKPVQLVIDGKVFSEIVIGYQNNLKKQTGG